MRGVTFVGTEDCSDDLSGQELPSEMFLFVIGKDVDSK